jgi:hypothetical protein
MKRKLQCAAVLTILCVIGFAQESNEKKSPKIVAKVFLANSSTTVPLTTLFTPDKPGLYRLTAYLSGIGTQDSFAGAWVFELLWTDPNGVAGSAILSVSPGSPSNRYQQTVSALVPGAGTPVRYLVSPSNPPPPQNSTYTLLFTVEKLEPLEP